MTFTDYLMDIVLIGVVLLQIRGRRLTVRSMLIPIAIVVWAATQYLHGIPTAGNDLVLVAILALVGGAIGLASAQTVLMRVADGDVLARAGWASGFFWVLGMGSRFAFAVWVAHGGASIVGQFSAHHQITSGAAWTAALLAMAVFEVWGRTLVLAARRHQIEQRVPAVELA
jgi:hypothetical protein